MQQQQQRNTKSKWDLKKFNGNVVYNLVSTTKGFYLNNEQQDEY